MPLTAASRLAALHVSTQSCSVKGCELLAVNAEACCRRGATCKQQLGVAKKPEVPAENGGGGLCYTLNALSTTNSRRPFIVISLMRPTYLRTVPLFPPVPTFTHVFLSSLMQPNASSRGQRWRETSWKLWSHPPSLLLLSLDLAARL